MLGLALAAAALHAAVVVQRTLTRLPPAEFIAALPVVARAGSLGPPPNSAPGQTFANDDTLHAGDLTIRRTLTQPNWVEISVARGKFSQTRSWDRNRGFVVRHDPGSNLMFFDDGEGPRAISSSEPTLVMASHFDLLPAARPPPGWLLSALVGCGGAVMLLLLRRRRLSAWSPLAFSAVVTAMALSGVGPL